MARLPQPGADNGAWGDILNDFLLQAHKDDGTLKDSSVSEILLDTSVRTKLNTVAPVTSVASKTGDVLLTRSDVGLSNVANTSDADKPVSTATQSALDGKISRNELVANVKDYGAVGDGTTSDAASIQAAITAVKNAGGGIVFFPRGIYSISTRLLVDGNNITLQGAGRTAAVLKTTSNIPIIKGENASGLSVRDLQLLGDGDTAKTSQMGIRWEGVSNSLIHNVYAREIGYDGICLLTLCVSNTVSNCQVSNSGDDGINVGGSGPDSGCLYTVVIGNSVNNCSSSGIHISDGSSWTTCVGNTVQSCRQGIDTFQSGTAATAQLGNNTISGNTIRDSIENGIYLRDTSNNVVSDNRVDGGQFGIRANRCSRNVFDSNVASGTSSYGFRDENTSSDTNITNNIFYGATCGVSINGARARFQGNSVKAVTGTAIVVSAVDASVSSNTVTDGTAVGISIVGVSRCVVSNNRVSGGTTLISVSSGATNTAIATNVLSGGTTGISVAANDCVVSSNIIDTQTTYGISISASGADCSISGNMLTGQGTYGIFVNGSTRAHISSNHFRSSTRPIHITNATDTFVDGNVSSSSSNGAVSEGGATGTILLNNRFDASVFLGGTTPIHRELGADYVNNGSEYNSTSNYQRSVWKQTKTLLSAVSGATVTATNLIPAGALLFGITTRINTALGNSNGTTGYIVGTGADTDLWGSITSIAAGAATGSAAGTGASGYTASGASGILFTTAQSVIVTATGGNFNGTGEIEVVAHYMICEAS